MTQNYDNSIQAVIKQLGQNKKIPAMDLVKPNPELAAIISKMVYSRDPEERAGALYSGNHALNTGQVQVISETSMSRIRDNEYITQLFPDIELAIQILISSILSPKDMVKTELLYTSEGEMTLPSDVSLRLKELIKKHWENLYDIRPKLSEILRESLFTTGSYISAVLPESLVDEIINNNNIGVATESAIIESELYNKSVSDNKVRVKSLGFLGRYADSQNSIGLESLNASHDRTEYLFLDDLKTDQNLEITDNLFLLKLPKLKEAAIKETTKNLMSRIMKPSTVGSVSCESIQQYNIKNANQISSRNIFKDSQSNSMVFMTLPSSGNLKRKSVGRPLRLKLPSESVIPIYVPGNESQHIGYFVAIDGDGHPVSYNSNKDSLQTAGSILNGQTSQTHSLSSLLIDKAKRNLIDSTSAPTLEQLAKIYGNIVENNIVKKLKNGIYGQNVKVGETEDLYRIMMSRSLAGRFTRLVFIPSEYVTYYAFKFFPNGVGKSFLDEIKILTSLRAIVMFAKVMAMTKSAINLTHVNMVLDPRDPDPKKTITMASNEIMRMRQMYFPLGINSPTDLVDWIQKAGVEMSFEGHPRLPTTKFEFESKNQQHQVPDTDLDENYRKHTYMAFGISPETIDNGFNTEFATTAVQNNILLSKRVSQTQDQFTPLLTQDCIKTIKADSIFIREALKLLAENENNIISHLTEEEKELLKGDNKHQLFSDILERYLDTVKIELPKPDQTTLANLTTEFDNYSTAIDKGIEQYISQELVNNNITGNVSEVMDTLKAIVKSYYLRDWMAKNNYLPELAQLTSSEENGKASIDLFESNATHIKTIMRSTLRLIKALKPSKLAANKDMENLDVDEGSQITSSSSDADGGGSDDGGMSFDMGEFGLDDESGGDSDSTNNDSTPPADDNTTETNNTQGSDTSGENKDNTNNKPE
jgi:hypothetical protein